MKRFKKVYIEITNACNLACSFCPRSERKPEFMNLGFFAEVLEQIRPYTDYIYLHVKGEPLLHPDIGKMLDMSFEKGIKVNITSNGTLIGQAKEKIISKPALRQINFSLHSMLEVCGLHELRDSDTNNITLPAAYLDSIFSFIREAREKTDVIVSLRLWNLDDDGSKANHRKSDFNNYIFGRIEREFELPYKIGEIEVPARGVKIAERVYLNRDYEFRWPDINISNESFEGFCYGMKDQAAILVDGTVVPCCLDGEGIINLGNLHQTDFSDIISSERAENILAGFSRRRAVEELCRKCGYRTRFDSQTRS